MAFPVRPVLARALSLAALGVSSAWNGRASRMACERWVQKEGYLKVSSVLHLLASM